MVLNPKKKKKKKKKKVINMTFGYCNALTENKTHWYKT